MMGRQNKQDMRDVFQNFYSSYLYDKESPKPKALSLPGLLLVSLFFTLSMCFSAALNAHIFS